MTNSPDRPINYGQVSVFQSPHRHDILLADIALFDKRGALEWCAINHETMLYKCALSDYRHGILETVNYSLFIGDSGRPV